MWFGSNERKEHDDEADEDSNPIRIIDGGVHVKLVVSQRNGRHVRTEMKDLLSPVFPLRLTTSGTYVRRVGRLGKGE